MMALALAILFLATELCLLRNTRMSASQRSKQASHYAAIPLSYKYLGEDLLLDPAGLPDPVIPLLGNPHGPHQLRHGIKDTVETVPAVDVLRVLSTLLSAEISFLNVSTPDRAAEALLQKCCLPPSRSAVAKMLHV